MRAVKITVSHGHIWVVELSSGVRAQGASPTSALGHILKPADAAALGEALGPLFDKIPDPGDHGNIGRGRASA